MMFKIHFVGKMDAAENRMLERRDDLAALIAQHQAAANALNDDFDEDDDDDREDEDDDEDEDDEEEEEGPDTDTEALEDARADTPPYVDVGFYPNLAIKLFPLVQEFPWKVGGLKKKEDRAKFDEEFNELHDEFILSRMEQKLIRTYMAFFKYDDFLTPKRFLLPHMDTATWARRLEGFDPGLTPAEFSRLKEDPWYQNYLKYRAIHQIHHELTTQMNKPAYKSAQGFMNVINPATEELTVGDTEPASNAAEAGPASAPEAGRASKRSRSAAPVTRAIHLPAGIPQLIASYLTGVTGSFAQQRDKLIPPDPYVEEYVARHNRG
jgi:hypothetical protein